MSSEKSAPVWKGVEDKKLQEYKDMLSNVKASELMAEWDNVCNQLKKKGKDK